MLDPFLQGQIIGMHKAGLKSRKIALDLAVNDRTVRAIIKRYQERGTLAPKPIPGRPRHSDRPPSSKDVADAVNEGGAKGEGAEGEEGGEGGAMDMTVDTSTTDGVETMISKKTGKVIKKRGKRGPYKKREKAPVVAPLEPVLIVPQPGADALEVSAASEGSESGTAEVKDGDPSITVTATSVQERSVVRIEERENVKAGFVETDDMKDSDMT
ncbi:hypothetical protein BG015_000639 [Linnemannia schmuckeri]|uniref:Paired domain-containing protein n=1 Tax=Linnemannia schmuckeri TaxID=64567 RepID=A0A9P5RUC4_9FUNG|nr:hypothetical protein BG015_000639 [Linnemannia schmuckeri]